MIGYYNRRWKDAYKNSYYYLYESDPEFKSFYNNRKSLISEEKAVSLQLVEKDFEITGPCPANASGHLDWTGSARFIHHTKKCRIAAIKKHLFFLALSS